VRDASPDSRITNHESRPLVATSAESGAALNQRVHRNSRVFPLAVPRTGLISSGAMRTVIEEAPLRQPVLCRARVPLEPLDPSEPRRVLHQGLRLSEVVDP
jgi:hypothetical protein